MSEIRVDSTPINVEISPQQVEVIINSDNRIEVNVSPIQVDINTTPVDLSIETSPVEVEVDTSPVTVEVNTAGVTYITGASTLEALTDVTLAAVTTGDVLTYNGLEWVNEQPTGGGGGNYIASDGNTTLTANIQVDRTVGVDTGLFSIAQNAVLWSVISNGVNSTTIANYVDNMVVNVDGVEKIKVDANGLKLSNGTPATGDVYYRDSNGVLYPLPIGTAGQVLTVDTGLPSWQTPTGGAGLTAEESDQLELAYTSANFLLTR